MAKLLVKGQIDYVDLRKITAKVDFLTEMVKKHKLKHLECVVFTNNYRYKPRFRMIINLYDEPFLVIPVIDETGKHSMYIRISEFLSKYAGLDDTRVELKSLASEAKKRKSRKQKRSKGKKSK